MRNIKTYIVIMICFLLFTVGRTGYTAEPVSVPVDSERWEFSDPDPTHHQVEEYLGQKSILLVNGEAQVKDIDFANGIIEMDLAFERGFGFLEAVWHVSEDDKQLDKLYIRPHKSPYPDSVQYAPIINGIVNWQMYYLPNNTAAVAYPFNEWFHVKIVTVGKYAEIYMIDMEKPVLTVNLTGNSFSGKIGLKADNSQKSIPLRFANFSYTVDDNPPLKGTPPEVKAEPTAVKNWLVSNAVEETILEGKLQVTEADRNNLTWVNLDTEVDGKGNIAKVQDASNITAKPSKNTVFTRATIISDKDQKKLMKFGFSDKVKLYFNGELLYQENQAYRTRNYWFMGNMGYFNEIYLPLKKGNNELWMAISEGPQVFAGWGVQAMFENLDGIAFDNAQQMNLDSSTPAGGDCTATYSLADGRVHIPCISVPNPSGGASVYEADIVQLPLAPGVYIVDENSIKPR
jgi:hypothetical protein